MDYKNRVPGSRYRNPRRPINRGVWVAIAAVAAVALIYGLWPAGGDGETAQVPQEPLPATTSQQLAVPPMGPPANPKDKSAAGRNAADSSKPTDTAGAAQTKPDPKKPEQEKITATDPVTPPVEPRFTFYKILPEKEVIIPETEIKAIKRDEDQGHAAKPQQYLIQVGSYNTPAEAEKVRSHLSQLKVKSKIEAVRIENTQWYRVKIGPFDKLAEADKVRDYLKANQLPSVVQKSTGK